MIAGCDDSPPPRNPFEPPADAARKPPPMKEQSQPEGAPDFHIDTVSPKVGFQRAVLLKPEDRAELARQLAEHKKHIEGKDVRLRVDRKAPMKWVIVYVEELEKLGAGGIVMVTETREEFPKEVRFTPLGSIGSPPSCSVVAIVMEDRGTAVWKLSGGVASRREKGFAGPDLTMTAETLERMGKACKESDAVFVSAAEGIEWGLAYDLAASAKNLAKVSFGKVVLLRQVPVPGHKVDVR
jgi:hypothetical protein